MEFKLFFGWDDKNTMSSKEEYDSYRTVVMSVGDQSVGATYIKQSIGTGSSLFREKRSS